MAVLAPAFWPWVLDAAATGRGGDRRDVPARRLHRATSGPVGRQESAARQALRSAAQPAAGSAVGEDQLAGCAWAVVIPWAVVTVSWQCGPPSDAACRCRPRLPMQPRRLAGTRLSASAFDGDPAFCWLGLGKTDAHLALAGHRAGNVRGRVARIQHRQRRRGTCPPLPGGGQVAGQIGYLLHGGIGVIFARAAAWPRSHPPTRKSPTAPRPAHSAASPAGNGPRPRRAPAPSPSHRRTPHPGGPAASRRSRTSADPPRPRVPSPPPAAAAAWPHRSARRPGRHTPTRDPGGTPAPPTAPPGSAPAPPRTRPRR